MSNLPPKLYERLKKRGIIKDDNESQLKKPCTTESIKKSFIVNGCPNKYNEYHDCSNYCEITFGAGMIEPTSRIKKIYECLIENYPLEENWISVWESGCARFYFFNKLTNEVSWFPPGHSQFKTTKPINLIKGITDLNNLSATSNNQQTDNELVEKQSNELVEKQSNELVEKQSNELVEKQSNEDKFNDELNQLDKELNEELNNENRESDGSSQKSSNSDQDEESSNED